MKRDILSEFEKRTSRWLSNVEREAIATLLLAESAGQIIFPKDRRARLRMFEKARRQARLVEIGLRAKAK